MYNTLNSILKYQDTMHNIYSSNVFHLYHKLVVYLMDIYIFQKDLNYQLLQIGKAHYATF